MKLTKRELAVMGVLWDSAEALMVSEIVKREPKSTIFSVQRVIKNLLSKGMVTVDSHEYSHKTLARKFKAVVSAEDFEIENMQKMFSALTNKEIPASHLVASLLSTVNDDKIMDELSKLEEIIKAKKQSLT